MTTNICFTKKVVQTIIYKTCGPKMPNLFFWNRQTIEYKIQLTGKAFIPKYIYYIYKYILYIYITTFYLKIGS